MWSLRRPKVLVAMSQSTITAFFSRSTPRTLSQKTPKRSRSESSDSDNSNKKGSPRKVPTSPTSSPIKKKSIKRQRIDSSSNDELSPNKENIKLENSLLAIKEESPKCNKLVFSPPPTSNLSSKEKKVKHEDTVSTKRKGKSNKCNKTGKVDSVTTSDGADTSVESGAGNEPEVSEDEYNPGKSDYHPVRHACWSRGHAVPYLALAKTLEVIETTSARTKIVETLRNYLRSVIALTEEDLLPSVYLCLNRLAPAHHALELGMADTHLLKAIGESSGRTLGQMRAALRSCGDLGELAARARASQRLLVAPRPLTVRAVLEALRTVARETGAQSAARKVAGVRALLVACRGPEARYLVRGLGGALRVGLAEQSVIVALAGAAGVTERSLRTAYCECPDLGRVVPALLAGEDALAKQCGMSPGTPLKPMLARPARGVAEVLSRFEGDSFTCEYKYDGERAQLHVPADETGVGANLSAARVFSRNQEDTTSKYPDVLGRLPRLLGPDVSSCVLDTEAVAYNTDTQQILPFQVLSTRKRKDAQESSIKVQVCVFVFDLLYLNGRPLVTEPLEVRRDLLRRHFRETLGEWQFATSRDCSGPDDVQDFLESAVRDSCEGLMVKTLQGARAGYEIARRSRNWLKLKKDYLEGVGDSVDAVVLGAYMGRGRRAGLYGGFLLGCYQPDGEEYQTVCKIGTGFSDEDLRALHGELAPLELDHPPAYYSWHPALQPDVWLPPGLVLEVRCADLSLSPVHRAGAGMVAPDRGLSLRFPRYVRRRPDKRPEEATTARRLTDLYLQQDQVRNQPAPEMDPDDFY